MLLLAASPKQQFVFADIANNNANAIHLLQGGPAITVGYSISPNSGCHVGDGIGGNPAPVYITIDNPAPSYITITSAKFVTGTVNGHTIPPNTLKFTSCNVNQDVVYSAPSTATIGKIVGTVTAFQSSQISNTNPGNLNIFVENSDNTAPTITVPAAMIVQATSQSGAAVTYAVTATDPDDAVATLSCTPTSGSTFAFGTTTVNCSATDTHGNTSTASFTVTVVDTTKPVVTVHASKTDEATGPSSAAATFSTSASYIVDL